MDQLTKPLQSVPQASVNVAAVVFGGVAQNVAVQPFVPLPMASLTAVTAQPSAVRLTGALGDLLAQPTANTMTSLALFAAN